MTKILLKMITITVIVTIFFCGCTKKEFSNDKWRVKLISAEFNDKWRIFLPSRRQLTEDLYAVEWIGKTPLAIHLTLDYIGPTGTTRMPDIYVRTGDVKTKVHKIEISDDIKNKDKIDLIIRKDFYLEAGVEQNEKIFGEKGCVLLFDMDKDITYCSLMIDELPPILIKF